MQEESLNGRVSLVIGAGATGDGIGNGRAMALTFARRGALVVAVDRDLASVERTREMVLAEGGQCLALRADAAVSADLQAAVQQTLERHGRLDVLVNNVGIVPLGGPVELAESDWDRAFAVNVKSAFLACKHVLPAMLRQRRGAIVHVSSLASIRSPASPYCAYAASKAAMNGLSQSVALQYAGQGIRSNVLMLGMIDTPHVREQLAGTAIDGVDALMARRHAQSPSGAMGTVWEAAAAAAFLASDAAAYINGTELLVDGGLHRRVG
ncbi:MULTISPECIES: SDR family NAD(P)-dependent oxidoreductase [Hydrogenophaga]|uniref:Dehydrogenase n=1 Tax=Hydrogenophaga intermedia TaxID=65786 RepID=A0A1L1PT21_HYDIT|nr:MULTISPECIES: SDR family oxidoreductase [Hydrogenophaga]AOS81620.1 3-oxoacyl-ACP reductase [Hydrogenophaga sp. PBC]TMU71115.1 SDR family oxidoreductase [Hydrogenophaga intermedia]CDN89196.1 Dehydrogenase [Hydrogenophaga intermedia]